MPIDPIHEELEDSPRLTGVRDGSMTGAREFKVQWNAFPAFLASIFPPPFVRNRRVIQRIPARFPGYPRLLANSFDVKPFHPRPLGLGETVNIHTHAHVIIGYTAQPWDGEDPGNDGPGGAEAMKFASHSVSIGGEFATYPPQTLGVEDVPKTGVTAVDDLNARMNNGVLNTPVGEDVIVAVACPLIEHTLEWQKVPTPPWLAIRKCIGRVNAFEWQKCPPETLLFNGVEGNREIGTDAASRFWRLAYKFSEKNYNAENPDQPQGWNHFLQTSGPQAGEFVRIRRRVYLPSTRLAEDIDDSTATITVLSGVGFPDKFYARIENEVVKVTAVDDARTTWTVTRSGLSTTNAAHAKNKIVQQVRVGTCSLSGTTMTVTAGDQYGFPTTGQFACEILTLSDDDILAGKKNEIVLVFAKSARDQLLTTSWTVVRGSQGTQQRTAASKFFRQVGLPVYQLADFRTLFKKGSA